MITVASQPLILLGAGGHAKVLLSLITALGGELAGVCDPALARAGVPQWRGIPVLGGDEALTAMSQETVGLINGVGQTVGDATRRQLYEKLRSRGFRFPRLVHPMASVAAEARLAEGVQVMAGAVLQADCEIGENTIINTRASVDHDAWIGPHVHLAPGAILCGGVRIGAGAFVAAGATVIQGIEIGDAAVVGAGVAAVRDLPPGQVLLGAASRLGRSE